MKHDITILFPLQAIQPTALITGSFVVNPELANDIDIVLLYDEKLYDKLVNIGFHQTNKDEYLPDLTLLTTWRFNNYNLIVVKDEPAFTLWRVFTNIISSGLFDVSKKEIRVALHTLIKQAYQQKVKLPIDIEH